MASTSASAVTRYLRQHDVVTLPSGTPFSREGVRVSAGVLGSVTIDCYFVGQRLAEWVAAAIRDILLEGGFTVEPNPHDATILTVTKEH